MAQAIEDMIYAFVAQKGPTQLAEIQAWSQASNMSIYDVNIALKRLIGTGRLYYIRRGLLVANPKKAGNLSTIQPGMSNGSWAGRQQPQQTERVSSSSWAGGISPVNPGSRIRL